MIVTPVAYGRMGNRLILAANWIANAEETGISYLHLRMGRCGRFFENLRNRPALFYRPGNPVALHPKRFMRIVDITRSHDARQAMLDPLSEAFRDIQLSTRYVLTLGWGFRCPQAVRKHRLKIVDFFRPAREHHDRVARMIDEARRTADHVVGVHIRRSDYAAYQGGKWLFDDAVYRQVMDQTVRHLNGRVQFILCSDEDVPLEAFQGLDVMAGPRHPFQDNLCLSRCDRIIAPPSTYSKWAAFYGDVPIHVIRNDRPLDSAPVFTRVDAF